MSYGCCDYLKAYSELKDYLESVDEHIRGDKKNIDAYKSGFKSAIELFKNNLDRNCCLKSGDGLIKSYELIQLESAQVVLE